MISLLNEKRIHIIGIGGIGMSAIAEILLNFGCEVSGSDLSVNSNTKKLANLGVRVFHGHSHENIEDVDLVVFSSAVSKSNPEIIAATDKSIPVLKRSQILADIMRLKNGVAIAGTHGKTTTTSLVATILKSAGIDPTYLIGGIVKNLDGHAHVGKGDLFVVEADESDGTFLDLSPVVSGITNIDFDHLDFYGDEKNLISAFEQFSNLIPFYGKVIFNYDDPFSRMISQHCKKPFSLMSAQETGANIDYSVRNIEQELGHTTFDLFYRNEFTSKISVALNGVHNIQNCLLAIAISHELGACFDKIVHGLKEFNGVGRRLEILESNEEVLIIDDYGHHPTEVESTIKTVSSLKKEKELTVVFEPHRFSRTQNCWSDFLNSFQHADRVYILPIYAAGEEPIDGVTSLNLVEDLKRLDRDKYMYSSSLENIYETEKDKGNIILTMGAGKIGRNIRELIGIVE